MQKVLKETEKYMLSWLRILNSIKVWDEINKRIGIVKSG
jgi:hypothetical protein